MAVINTQNVAELRQNMAREGVVTWTKVEINAAFQAIEDTFENARPVLGNAIESVAPGFFTNSQKAKLVKHWLRYKLGVS